MGQWSVVNGPMGSCSQSTLHMKILQGIPNKREFLAKLFGRLGVLGLLERVAAAMRPGLVALTYHRIAEPGMNPFYDPVISATPDAFRAQVEWLRRRFRILSLPELVAGLESGSCGREPSALLTFDDGYRDNFEVAVPILRECGVPATFFLPTAFLEAPRLPWWDHVAYVIKQTQARRLVLERSPDGGAPPIALDLETMPRSASILTVIRAFLDATIADGPWFLDQLAARAAVAVDSPSLARDLFTSWDQVRRLTASAPGVLTIGSHGHSHQKLAGLDGQSQRLELIESKRILESRLQCAVTTLAYPYGWPGTYTAETKALAAEAGYRLAFAAREGVNRPDSLDRYEILRLGVGSGDSPFLLRARTALHATFGKSFL
jgi:peptidoglycan/xylan/chitin deacetylase (PgdA/CDA1 family)